MPGRLFAFLLFCLVFPATANAACPAPPPAARPLRILFVGNSLTYYNDMPAIVEAVGAANGVRIETGLVASGGATLHDHLASGDAAAEIRASRWDYVLLQEQSSFGDTYLVDGRFRVRPTERWIADAAALGEEARRSGARPVLLVHWAMRGSPEDGPTIEALYARAARRIGACLIRNGPALRRAEQAIGRNALYQSDGLHPTPLASYVMAAGIVRLVGHRPVRQLPLSVSGEPIEQEEGRRLGGTAVLVAVDAARARQIAAWADSASDRPGTAAPASPPTPALPRGTALPASLTGRWEGPLRLYPIPATIALAVAPDGRSVDVRFRSAAGEEMRRGDHLPLVRSRQGIGFVFPQGPNGTQIRFEGRFLHGALSGIAHFRSTDGSLEGIGSWTAAPVRGGPAAERSAARP
jgi:hypothetical protein